MTSIVGKYLVQNSSGAYLGESTPGVHFWYDCKPHSIPVRKLSDIPLETKAFSEAELEKLLLTFETANGQLSRISRVESLEGSEGIVLSKPIVIDALDAREAIRSIKNAKK